MKFRMSVKQLRRIIKEELEQPETPQQEQSLDKDPTFIRRLLHDMSRALRLASEDYLEFRRVIMQIVTGKAYTSPSTQTDESLALANVKSSDPKFEAVKQILLSLPAKLPRPAPDQTEIDTTDVIAELTRAKSALEQYADGMGAGRAQARISKTAI